MFALIAQIEDYPKFLPLCEDLTVRRREQRDGKEVLTATMVVGYKFLRESFTTQVSLDPSSRTILIAYLDGPFSFLENRWHFVPLGEKACEVDFYIAYSFRSHMFERLMGGLFDKAVRNPHVDILGHATGRLLLRRGGYAVDMEQVLPAAAEAGTMIELNANPWRLDLDPSLHVWAGRKGHRSCRSRSPMRG